MNIIFWCEFPEKVNWQKLKKQINFPTYIYIASKTKQDFIRLKKKIQSKFIKVGAWPILSKEDGYWFSGYTSKENIDRLDQFKGLEIKVDIEPPFIDEKYIFIRVFLKFIYYLIRKGPNNSYLKERIKALHAESIISGFPFAYFIKSRFGGDIKHGIHNYMCYTSFFPKYLRFLARLYYKLFIKSKDKKHFFAIGLTTTGIFNNEPIYENQQEFIKDLDMIKRLNVENLVIYSIEGLQKRNWIDIVKRYI